MVLIFWRKQDTTPFLQKATESNLETSLATENRPAWNLSKTGITLWVTLETSRLPWKPIGHLIYNGDTLVVDYTTLVACVHDIYEASGMSAYK